MSKDKSGKSGSKKRPRQQSDWGELRYAGGPERSGAPLADAVAGEPAASHGASAARSATHAASTNTPAAASWRAADDDRWAVERMLELCADEQRAARKLHGRALGFFLGLPVLFGLASVARGVGPVAADSAVPALRVIALLAMLAALGSWFVVLRTRIVARPELDELGWEPGEPSERRAGERLVSARRRVEGQLQQARNEAAKLSGLADRALVISAVSIGCLALVFALTALG